MKEPGEGGSEAGLREAIVRADKRHVWHPYTAMGDYIDKTDPLVIARAHGSTLVDVDGREYIDGNASWYTAALGHSHPRIVEIIAKQARTLGHAPLAGITHEHAAFLAAALSARTGGALPRVFYTDNGSTAIEVAMRIALQSFQQRGEPKRRRFLALEGAYHGDTLGPTSLGDVELFRRPFAGMTLECVRVPFPDPLAHERAFRAVRDCLLREGDTIAAVVVEPLVQATAGMRIYDAEYLRVLRQAATSAGALLIVDEVFAGYGRTGTFFASEQAGITGDLVCVGKAFAHPIPMGAVLASEALFDAFRGGKDRALYYGHTFCGNPLGAAVAREVLAVFDAEEVLPRARASALRIARGFAEIAQLPGVARTRTLGVIGAADLEEDGAGGGYLGALGWRVFEEARRRGAYLRPLGDTVYVTPPLTISEPDLDRLLAILHDSIEAALRPRAGLV